MAKKLIIYRHAKSDWDADYGEDHDRPLSRKGVKSAEAMGKLVGSSKQTPDIAITSTALRAKQTLEISMLEGNWRCDTEENGDIYYGGADEVFEIIKNIPDKYETAIIVGHEPKCSTLATRFIGGGQVVFPTAAMARIDFDVESWSHVDYGIGELRWHHQPSFFLKGKFAFS